MMQQRRAPAQRRRPRPDSRFRYHGDGVLSKMHADRRGDPVEVFYVRYAHNRKRYTEQAGTTIGQARAKLAAIERERRLARLEGVEWTPPPVRRAEERERRRREEQEERERRRREEQEQRAATRRRDALLYEPAVAQLIERTGARYSDGGTQLRLALERVGRAFGGRFLDEITRADVQRYIDDRLNNAGPFAEWKRRVGPRVPQQEIAALRVLYSWVIEDQGLEGKLSNPCSNAWRRRATKSDRYRPKHSPVIPDADELHALLSVAPEPPKHYREKGRAQWAARWRAYRAAWALAFYTGARPESELCAIAHADVELPDEHVASIDGQVVLGRVTFRDTKTGGDRTIPLHPVAAESLRAIMRPRPDDEGEIPAWAAAPVFGRPGSPREPWTRDTYRRAWATTLEEIAEGHERLSAMWLRDLRKTFRTMLTTARVPEPTIRRLMGHSVDVSQGYYELTPDRAVAAILALPTVETPEYSAGLGRHRGRHPMASML